MSSSTEEQTGDMTPKGGEMKTSPGITAMGIVCIVVATLSLLGQTSMPSLGWPIVKLQLPTDFLLAAAS